MDFSGFLVLYSGGADSTFILAQNESARHLLHYTGMNAFKTKVAVANAMALDRSINLRAIGVHPTRDGEVGLYHSLEDSFMVTDAAIYAVKHGMRGIVLGFNKDDIGVPVKAIREIVAPVAPDFQIVEPLREISATEVRKHLAEMAPEIPTVSCMIDRECGICPKCRRGY
ncbi:hypothetical protein ACLB6G_01520 [Zhengella sp. ZM62]|uniref:hypothetical protein n=1 Tax=Zhengella sedimenti TaxID=3390035 RepID=UPI00397687BF